MDMFGYAGNFSSHKLGVSFLAPPSWLLKAGGPGLWPLHSIPRWSHQGLWLFVSLVDLHRASDLYIANCLLSIYTGSLKRSQALTSLKMNLFPNLTALLHISALTPHAFPIRCSDFAFLLYSSLPQSPTVSHLCFLFILISYYTRLHTSLLAVVKHHSSF